MGLTLEEAIKYEIERCKNHKEKNDGIDTYWLGRIDALYFVLEILKGKRV